jgi:hypothetical protein
VKAAAATATAAAGGAGSTPAVQEKLLTAPVPHAAAELLQQHAAAVMAAVQQLLEAVSTPPELLGPLLQLLLEVIRLAHVVVTGENWQGVLPRRRCAARLHVLGTRVGQQLVVLLLSCLYASAPILNGVGAC